MKQSFLLYHDTLSVIEELTDEQAGKLIKEIYTYSVSLNNPDEPQKPSGLTGLMSGVFHPFKMQLNRDAEKYKNIVKKRRDAGIASGKARNKSKQVLASVKGVEQNGTKRTLSVSDSVSVNDSDKDNVKENKIIYTHTPKTLKTIDEILLNGKHEKHDLIIRFIAYIKKNLQNVSKLPKQMSYVEAGKLFDQYSPVQVKAIVNQMENWKPLTKKNNSVYLTILSWIGRER